jgi:ABC-type transport system involved in cytochrome c biogenesis ATPase subunit
MLTRLQVKNFKNLEEIDIELGERVLLIGPNNSGKTSALQALVLWETGLRKWLEKRAEAAEAPQKRPGVTINRKDLIAAPAPEAKLFWRNLRVRSQRRENGKPKTDNILIDISVSGIYKGRQWEIPLEFDYANPESFYCRPSRSRGSVEDVAWKAAKEVQVAFLPPMSGLAAEEDRLQSGSIHKRIGEGRTAEVLRNLCFEVHQKGESEGAQWGEMTEQIERLFGVKLLPPQILAVSGQIVMHYRERDVELDLSCSGRGLQQTLLLLAYLHAHPSSVLLLDEPDAHLEILRQRQIYEVLEATARATGGQIIAASHSEVLLAEAAGRDIVIAFLGKPHRIDNRGSSQLQKALRDIPWDQYAQAAQTGWVLYLEGSTDLEILRRMAEVLEHPAAQALQRPFVRYVSNNPSAARDHFHGLKEALPELVGVAVFDRLEVLAPSNGGLTILQWSRNEIENYLDYPDSLRRYASCVQPGEGPLIEEGIRVQQIEAMDAAIAGVSNSLRTLKKPGPESPDLKASTDFLEPVFANYYETLRLPNQMRKTNFHELARFIPSNRIDSEVVEKLDAIWGTYNNARPLT